MRAIPREFLISFALALATPTAFGGGAGGHVGTSRGSAGRNVHAFNAAPRDSFRAALQYLPSSTSPYLAARPSTVTETGTIHPLADSGSVHVREFRDRVGVQESIRPGSGMIDADGVVALSPHNAHKHSLSSGVQRDSRRRMSTRGNGHRTRPMSETKL
jgi:hypothetical protein